MGKTGELDSTGAQRLDDQVLCNSVSPPKSSAMVGSFEARWVIFRQNSTHVAFERVAANCRATAAKSGGGTALPMARMRKHTLLIENA